MSPRLSSILSLSTSNGLEIESPELNTLGDIDVFTTTTIFSINTPIPFGALITGGTATDATYQWSVSPSTGVVISAPTSAATNISFPDYNTEYVVTCQATSVTSGNSPQSDSVTILTEVETGGGDTAATYTSDFSKDTDGWVYGSTTSWGTDPDLDGNIDGVDGEDDTLRLTFNADPTGNVEIRSGDIATEGGFAVGDSVTISLKWRLEDTAPDLATMNLRVQLGNSYALDKIQTINSSTDETWVEETLTYSVEAANTSRFVKLQWGVGGFRPGSGDKFYIKDFTFTQVATASSPLPVYTGLLDTYPNAAAAYSLRRLTRNYTGALVEIQRYDNLETARIGYLSDGALDISSISSFCSGTTCGVKTWFDQSGSGNDATQTDITMQPAIYASGSVVRENGKPAAQFDGVNDYFTKAFTLGNPVSHFVVGKGANLNDFLLDAYGAVNVNSLVLATTNNMRLYNGSGISVAYTYGTQALFSSISNGASSSLAVNGTNTTGTLNGTTAMNGVTIGVAGNLNTIYCMDGTIQEVILYGSDEASNRTGIEDNINNFYNIYTPFAGGLLDDYPDAAAAYSLRRLATAYTGPAIRVRRASDNAEQDIQFNSDGTLNTTQLESFCSATDGFVKTWYCQANGNDATQGTNANQPQIVSSGSVITENGKPTVRFINQYLTSSASFSFAGANILVGSNQTGSFEFATSLIEDNDNQLQMFLDSRSSPKRLVRYEQSATAAFIDLDSQIAQGTQSLLMYNNDSGTLRGYVDGTAVSDTLSFASLSVTELHLARLDSTSSGDTLDLQECIWWPSDQSTNRTGIESNINTYYSIYE